MSSERECSVKLLELSTEIDKCLQVEVWEVFVSYGLKDLVSELKAKNSVT